jgi:hypothetical protein
LFAFGLVSAMMLTRRNLEGNTPPR